MAQPASARVAGIIARSDNERGFWWSPSNQKIYGISGSSRAIDFTLGDSNARANLLNESEVVTIIHQDGYRLWGNRTCSSDPKWAFLSVRRTAEPDPPLQTIRCHCRYLSALCQKWQMKSIRRNRLPKISLTKLRIHLIR